METIKHTGRIYEFNPLLAVWQYRLEETQDWKQVTNKLILKLLEWDELEGFEYLHLSGDTCCVEAFVMQDYSYDLDLAEQKLLNHPFMTLEKWDFILSQRAQYQEMSIKVKQYSDAWCAPHWDSTQHALYKESKEKQLQIIKDACKKLQEKP